MIVELRSNYFFIRVNKKIIDDVDNSILKNIIDKGYDTSNSILNEYEKLAFKDVGSFEGELIDLRIFFNENGVELSIEK